MHANTVVLSLRPGKLNLLRQVDASLELKLDREDADLVTGERDLGTLFEDHDISPNECVSVHPPPGNSGREADMSIARGNVGTVVRFNDTQLRSVTPEFVVLHTVRRFDIRDQLFVLQEMAAKLDCLLAVENPPGSSYWATPEDHAFFADAAARADTPWALTVDTYHVTDNPATDFVDEDNLTAVTERIAADGVGADAIDRFRERVRTRTAEAPALDVNAVRNDPWLPTLRTLVLAGDGVQSLHFNDPVDDGIPDLTHGDSPVLEAIFDLVARHDIDVVLEPDTYDLESLREAIRAIRERLSFRHGD